MGEVLCRCGHPRPVHEHYRPGSDCGICGICGCICWSPPRWWWRWFLRLRHLEAENRRLRREILRLSGSEHALRNVIALHRFNPGPAA